MEKYSSKPMIVLFTAMLLAMAFAGAVHAQQPASEQTPAPMETQDPGWPRVLEKDGQKVVIYQPQVDSWDNYRKIAFRAAVAVTPKDEGKTTFGVVEVHADTKVDPDTRMVLADNIQRELRFPNLDEARADRLTAIINEAMPKRQAVEVALDRVLPYLDKQKAAQREVKVDLAPPEIFYSDRPAVLVLYRGAPEFQPVADTKLMFAVNANWDIFMDMADSSYYLLNKESWLTSTDPLKGWKPAASLPAEFSELPDTEEWKDVRANLPGKVASVVPAVFASDKPAEIILTEGKPKYSPIAGTRLMYVTNTESPLFLCNTDGNHYFLVAGRWFRAKTFQGPWEGATQSLQEEFAKIPEGHPRAFVLTSVPKTDAAEDAVLLASVPRKATVNRKEAKLEVAYDGEPTFATIKGTTVKCAVNTPEDVFEVAGQYYCCKDGVWFTAMKPQGPWLVCTEVPKDIYTIPPENPKHNVTYVYVYDSTPDTVEVGYTGGYTGQYVTTGGLLVYGAGLALRYALAHEMYEDWNDHWNGHWHNYYYHGPSYSYGVGAVYNPYYGGYYTGYGAVARPYGGAAYAYGPYGGVTRTAAYNPATGTYSRGAYASGPGGSAYARAAYNPYTNTAAARTGGFNAYGSWGRSAVATDDGWVRGGHNTTASGTSGWAQTSEGGAVAGSTRGENKFVGKTEEGDVYAGRDGNVYKREDGEWQKYNDGNWDDVNRPDRPSSQSAQSGLQKRSGATGSQTSAGSRNAASASQLPAKTRMSSAAKPALYPANQNFAGASRPAPRDVQSDLNFNQQARRQGNARANEYQRARSSPQPSQAYRPSSNQSSFSRSSSSYSRSSTSISSSAGSRSSGGRSGGGSRGRR